MTGIRHGGLGVQAGASQASKHFSWTVDDRESTRTIRFRGELDLVSVSEHRDELLQLVDTESATIEVCVEELSFADSTALRLFLDMKRIAEDKGKRFVFDRVSRPVARLLQVTGLTTHFS